MDHRAVGEGRSRGVAAREAQSGVAGVALASVGQHALRDIDPDTATVRDLKIAGQGCSISQASTSVMSDLVIGKSVEEALALHAEFTEMMHSMGSAEPDEDRLEDAVAFVGVAQFPARVKCALLGWSAFKDAAAQALASNGAGEEQQ